MERVATVVHRLAVLLAAGVAPHGAWGYMESGGDVVAHSVAHEVQSGVSVTEAILAATGSAVDDTVPARGRENGAPWRAVAAAWQVATAAGAPLAPALRSFAGSLRELAESRRDLRVALAGPAATTRIVMLLPLIGLLFGVALGFDTLGVIFGTVPGALCSVVGVALLFVARRWNRRLLLSATPDDDAPGLRLDLVAIAVSGGAALDRALASVDAALEHCAVSPRGADAVDEVIALSRRAGVPAAELLRAEAEEARRVARSAAKQGAAKLAVTLMVPLGVCILPAFMLVGVAPLMIAVISSTVTQL
ncbi:MAG: type II secretion system F family protein [Cryobacterium sp.]|nr:type II secretion system F family protein [Cryobacterium sp.]